MELGLDTSLPVFTFSKDHFSKILRTSPCPIRPWAISKTVTPATHMVHVDDFVTTGTTLVTPGLCVGVCVCLACFPLLILNEVLVERCLPGFQILTLTLLSKRGAPRRQDDEAIEDLDTKRPSARHRSSLWKCSQARTDSYSTNGLAFNLALHFFPLHRSTRLCS